MSSPGLSTSLVAIEPSQTDADARAGARFSCVLRVHLKTGASVRVSACNRQPNFGKSRTIANKPQDEKNQNG